jgi:Mn2+/Fe2+ NRAMP family transporter
MLLPPELAWIELVIIGTVAVFVADLIGNTISFHNRFTNALVTAVVFSVAFGLIVYFRYGTVMLMDWGFAVVKEAP